MERWDLYTEDRKLSGRSMARGEVIPSGLYHLVVGIWTVNSQGRVLLTMRHPEKEVYPNTWENSGGAAQMGETSLQAAVRELGEETGIWVRPEELVLLGSEGKEGAFVDCYLVHKDISLMDLVLQEGETTDARWATPYEVEQACEDGTMARPVARRWYQMRDKILAEIAKGESK